MSEVFDPECYTAIDHTDTSPGLYVTEATYLKLLALYREAVKRVMQWERPDSSNQMIP